MTREEALQVLRERMDYYEREKRMRAAIEVLVPELAESKEQEEKPEVDLEAFRREAAKDILAGFAAKIGHLMSDYSEQSCKCAIKLADELIKQLKEEKK